MALRDRGIGRVDLVDWRARREPAEESVEQRRGGRVVWAILEPEQLDLRPR